MPNLERLFRYEPFVPDIGDNRELADQGLRPFYFEIAVGLTKEQLRAVFEDIAQAHKSAAEQTEPEAKVTSLVAGIAAAVTKYVRFGREPLSFDGVPVTTLAEYLTKAAQLADGLNLSELPRALVEANSMEGTRELFFERLSGGFTSTAYPKTGRAGNQRAAP